MLIRRVGEALERLDCRGRHLAVAVSGGIDSMSLAQALHELAERWDLKLLIVHVNHGLRGEASEADERLVAAWADGAGRPFRGLRVDPGAARQARSSRDRPTLQEAARALRYAALREAAAEAGAERIATAHHVGDQAETVLLRLLRGTGPDGLGGIPERSHDGVLVRPLLRVGREEIQSFARERGLVWREDASNDSPAYARNRLRRDWLPGLVREFNPRLLRAIADLAEAQRRDSEWIAARVEQEVRARCTEQGGWLLIDLKDWGALPEALARRVARAALERAGAGRLVSRVHLERMCDFLASGRNGTQIELPGSLVLRRERAGARLGPGAAPPDMRDAC